MSVQTSYLHAQLNEHGVPVFANFSVIFGIVVWSLLTAGLIIYSLMYFVKVMRPLKFSIRPLLYNFGQKIWMTAGLGFTFLGLFVAIVLFGSLTLDSNLRLDIFFLLYTHPTEFIYLGLFVFVCVSLLTLLVRMIIKNIYNIKK